MAENEQAVEEQPAYTSVSIHLRGLIHARVEHNPQALTLEAGRAQVVIFMGERALPNLRVIHAMLGEAIAGVVAAAERKAERAQRELEAVRADAEATP